MNYVFFNLNYINYFIKKMTSLICNKKKTIIIVKKKQINNLFIQ